MNLESLIALHAAAIGLMNDTAESIRYLESALIKARAAHDAAVKNESALSAAVTAADRLARGVS